MRTSENPLNRLIKNISFIALTLFVLTFSISTITKTDSPILSFLVPEQVFASNVTVTITTPVKTQENVVLEQVAAIKYHSSKVSQEELIKIVTLVDDVFPNNNGVMLKILAAESQFDCSVKNPNSSARGCFQILTSTWKTNGCIGDVLIPADNIACAKILLDKYGTSPWNESKNVWGK